MIAVPRMKHMELLLLASHVVMHLLLLFAVEFKYVRVLTAYGMVMENSWRTGYSLRYIAFACLFNAKAQITELQKQNDIANTNI